MKMIFAIVQDDDAPKLVNKLMQSGISVTKLATTGGFLRTGNTTLMIGIQDERVDAALEIIEHACKKRKQTAPIPIAMESMHGGAIAAGMTDIIVGGATVFVMDVDKFVKY
ncbi:MAG: cyclic-di-AMP receptor [Eubacteriales bacterium]|nr:cyclic-di-AMP receptor [Eubacteriales bacterium]